MSRRRVLHLIDTGGPGGAETVFLDVVTGLHPGRWESVAVVPELDWLSSALEARGVSPVHLPATRSFDIGYAIALRTLIRERGIDVIHTHLLGSAVYASLAGRMAGGVPQISTFHGTVDVSPDDPLLGIKLRLLDRRSTWLAFVSESLRAHFGKAHRMRRAGQHVVYNGIDLETFRPGEAPDLRTELGAAAGEPFIGAIGNVRPAKSYDVLLRAVALLRDRGVSFRCAIVGEGSGALLTDLEALRDRLGLDGRVRLAGFRPDIDRILRALDLMVLSSSSEGFSLTTVQALASATPIVATRCGGPEEILEDGALGLLVEPGSPEALADGIECVLAGGEERERRVAAGLAAVRERFAVGSMVAGYETLYDRALDGGGPS